MKKNLDFLENYVILFNEGALQSGRSG